MARALTVRFRLETRPRTNDTGALEDFKSQRLELVHIGNGALSITSASLAKASALLGAIVRSQAIIDIV